MTDPNAQVELAVSTVIFALRQDEGGATSSLWLPLVRRVREPYGGRWALPGGPLRVEEALDDAARRNLVETTGLSPRYLEQLYSFGTPDRSPGQRVVSIVYWALVRPDEAAAGVEDENVRWFPAEETRGLAFDHDTIVEYALWRLRNKVGYARLAHAFLPDEFTLAQLRQVHEVVLQHPLDPANFRRQIEADASVVATGRRLTGGRHRPPRLFRHADPRRPE